MTKSFCERCGQEIPETEEQLMLRFALDIDTFLCSLSIEHLKDVVTGSQHGLLSEFSPPLRQAHAIREYFEKRVK